MNISAVASFVVARMIFDYRRRTHLAYDISIHIDQDRNRNISVGLSLTDNLQRTDFIFWDKGFMSGRHNLEGIDRTLRDIAHSNITSWQKSIVTDW